VCAAQCHRPLFVGDSDPRRIRRSSAVRLTCDIPS
jgi:hypothetical protein